MEQGQGRAELPKAPVLAATFIATDAALPLMLAEAPPGFPGLDRLPQPSTTLPLPSLPGAGLQGR